MTGFTAVDVPDQTGKTMVVTGANTGLGFETAKTLAGKGARVLLGCRSLSKAQAAKDKILSVFPKADIAIVELDLGSLASIQRAARCRSRIARRSIVKPFALTLLLWQRQRARRRAIAALIQQK